MPDYDFRALSPIDFEILVRDLLQKHLRITLESFRSGTDRGIDLRYSRGPGNDLIVQCKHWPDSTFPSLLKKLEKNEMHKVRTLRPQRYILATSINLTPLRKEKIAALFAPLVKSTCDIYGRAELNNLLTQYPEVEKNTFKLWFTSTNVFEQMLDRKHNTLSRETLTKIQRDAQVYVENGSFGEALKVLDRKHVCLIVGVPGIGKTMLAQMLLLHYYSLGYDIIKIEGDVSEAHDVDYEKRRRIFYYDDFLGQASIADKLNKNEDQKLLDFISAIQRSSISKFLLTTREYILNQAKLVYEKIDRTHFDSQTCIVDLAKYTRLNRAQILYNHLYFSKLPETFRVALLSDRAYLRIIDHPNYNPRLIEHLTDPARLAGIGPRDYIAHFNASLDNPEELWRHPFESQLSEAARDVLLVLLSLPSEVFVDDLRTAFCSYQNAIDAQPDSKLTRMFRRALKEIEGTFITSTLSEGKIVIEFFNPSIRDFLQVYLASSPEQLRTLIRSVVAFDQLHWIWEHRDRNGSQPFRSHIQKHAKHEFVRALRLIFVLSVYGLHNRAGYNGQTYKTWDEVSFERRASFVLSVVTELQEESTKRIWDQTQQHLHDRLNNKACDREDLIGLLCDIREAKLLSNERFEDLLKSTKQFLSVEFHWLSDYQNLIRFMTEFPDVFSAEEKSELAAQFPVFARQHVLSDLIIDDPDDYRTCAEEVKEIGTAFGVDVTELVSEIESCADYEESTVPPEREQSSYHRQPSLEWCSDTEIDSLFSELKTDVFVP
jgi:hypothetical protein